MSIIFQIIIGIGIPVTLFIIYFYLINNTNYGDEHFIALFCLFTFFSFMIMLTLHVTVFKNSVVFSNICLISTLEFLIILEIVFLTGLLSELFLIEDAPSLIFLILLAIIANILFGNIMYNELIDSTRVFAENITITNVNMYEIVNEENAITLVSRGDNEKDYYVIFYKVTNETGNSSFESITIEKNNLNILSNIEYSDTNYLCETEIATTKIDINDSKYKGETTISKKYTVYVNDGLNSIKIVAK